jgi:molybdopterin/thiamine biosynthesis adenylyltransferase
LLNSVDDDQVYAAQVFCEDAPDDQSALEQLRADPGVVVVDRISRHVAGMELDGELSAEPKRWIYYPWRRSVVRTLGPRSFRTVRLDRNRHLITADEQECLAALRIGVVGLSVGHAIAYTLAQEGVCGNLRLGDLDELELSNLNRVPTSVLDIGLNKSVVAARRIAELDPSLEVEVFSSGVTPQNVDDFLEGLDVLIEECDSLDVKITLREACPRS